MFGTSFSLFLMLLICFAFMVEAWLSKSSIFCDHHYYYGSSWNHLYGVDGIKSRQILSPPPGSTGWMGKQYRSSRRDMSNRQEENDNDIFENDDDDDEIDRRWAYILKESDEKATDNDKNRRKQDLNNSIDLNSIGSLRREMRQQSYQKSARSSQRVGDKAYMGANDFALNADTMSQLRNVLGDDFDALLEGNMENPNQGMEDDDSDSQNNLQQFKKAILTDDSDDNDNDNDSVFLDENAYLQYSDLQLTMDPRNGEGYNPEAPPSMPEDTLRDFAMPPNAIYEDTGYASTSRTNVNDQEPSMDDILELQRQMSSKRPTPEEEKAIFDQVFETEQAYLEQTSELFREGLTNKTAAEEANRERRSQFYRAKVLEDLNQLEEQIQDFEKMLAKEEQKNKNEVEERQKQPVSPSSSTSTQERANSRDQKTGNRQGGIGSQSPHGKSTNNRHKISKRQDFLTHPRTAVNEDRIEEIPTEEAPIVGGTQDTSKITPEEPKDEWVLVDDPDTGETFYWNAETGEMKWMDE